MNVIEQNTFHSEKSAPQNIYKGYGTGQGETLINNQSTDVKNHFSSKKGVLEVVKVFSSFRKVMKIAFLLVFTVLTSISAYACDCIAPPNNANQVINVNDIILGANKSYASFCGSYYLEFEVIPVGQTFSNIPNYTGSALVDVGAVPLPPVTIPFKSLIPGVTYQWQVRQIGGVSACPTPWTPGLSFTVSQIIVCPPTASLFGCSLNDINFAGIGLFPNGSLTEVEFNTLGGTIVPGTPPYLISYSDIVQSSSCPINVTRTFTVTDATGYIQCCDQTITVTDNIDPNINCPNDIYIYLGSGECERQVFWTVPASDNCSNVVPIHTGPDPGDILDKTGSPYNVNCFVLDECGGFASCSFNIYIIENTPDETSLSCYGLIHSSLDDSCKITVTPGMILTGNDYSCFEDYTVMVKECKTCPPIYTSPVITGDYLGDTLVVEICDATGDYCCWGYIVPEDKKKPTICCVDFSMSCTGETDPDSISLITKRYDFPGLPVLIPSTSPNQDTNVVVIELEIDECDTLEILDFRVY